MADSWQTFPVEFKGGLLKNLSPLQQGINAPGSATVLQNFEPSIEGGYRKIEGFSKADTNAITGSGLIRGLVRFGGAVIAARGTHLYRSTGSGWTQITDSTSFPASTATAAVNGATSNTTALVVDNNNGTILVGMVVTGTGISGTVTVQTVTDQNTLVLSSNQTLSNNVDLTFTEKSPTLSGSGRVRFAEYNFTGTDKLFIVDGNGKPYIFTGTSLAQQTALASDFAGADFVTVHLERLFVVIDTTVICSGAPSATSDDFSGSTSFEFDGTVTDIITFREQLIIFSQNGIKKLTGKTNSDFAILPITDDVGAIAPDTVQEVGGDVMFLAADGLRLLGATERIGDFSLAVVSKNIQPEFSKFTANSTSFSSITIREKSQYRIFGFNAGFTDDSALGIIGTQFASQGGEGMAWSETRGINSFVATSSYDSETEFIYFANDDGYVYRLESGNSFDGANIPATYQSPFFPVNDPRLRKTFYKLILYTEPTGSVDTTVSLKLDFEKDIDFQPPTISFSSSASNTFFFNDPNAKFNTATYGSANTQSQFESQLIGSGFTAALNIVSNDSNPAFSLDSATLEYTTNERR